LEVITFPDVPGAAYVSVDAIQLVPSDLITVPDVADAVTGNVGVLHEGAALEPLYKILLAVAVPESNAAAEAVE
jgi:hypothetical protein